MRWRLTAAVAAIVFGVASCGDSAPDLETQPDESESEPTPAERLDAAASAVAADAEWTHDARFEVGDLGSISGVFHHQAGVTRGSLDQLGTAIELWALADTTIISANGADRLVYPEPSHRRLRDALDPVAFLAAVATLPVDESEDLGGSSAFTVECLDRSGLPSGFLLAQACGPDAGTTITVELTSDDRLIGWAIDGSMETWPGNWASITGTGEYRSLDVGVDFVAPSNADSGPADCVAARLGIDPGDHDALGDALDDTSTVENEDLFTPCGFPFWPSGSDLHN